MGNDRTATIVPPLERYSLSAYGKVPRRNLPDTVSKDIQVTPPSQTVKSELRRTSLTHSTAGTWATSTHVAPMESL